MTLLPTVAKALRCGTDCGIMAHVTLACFDVLSVYDPQRGNVSSDESEVEVEL